MIPLGPTLAQNLNKSENDVTVIDDNESALDMLKECKIPTIKADVRSLDFQSLPATDTIAFVLLRKTFEDNLVLVKNLKRFFPR